MRVVKLALLVLALLGIVGVWIVRGHVPVPEGRVLSVVFVINPSRFADSFDLPVESEQPLLDREFRLVLDSHIAGSDASELFSIVASGRNTARVYWQYPYCEVHTDLGTYIVRIQKADVPGLLANAKASLLFYLDLSPEACPRLHSVQLTEAIRLAVRDDPVLKEEFAKLKALDVKDRASPEM